MEIRAASVLLLVLCAITVITTEGHIPQCCLKTSDTVKLRILRKVQKYDVQSDAGPCELKALILHVGKKKYCLAPKLETKVKKWLKKTHISMHAKKT